MGGLGERGDRPAVLAFRDKGVDQLSYAELADLARRLAQGLTGEGIGRGDRVALFASNRPEWMTACLAVLRAGAVAVPLDAGLEEESLRRILGGSGARLVFTTSDRLDQIEQLDLDARPVLLDAGEGDGRGWRPLLSDGNSSLPEVDPDDVAALFYTSGTTGAAKGVPLTHRNLVYQMETLLGEYDLVGDRDRVLLPLPLHHVYPFVVGMLTPLAAGLPVVLPRSLTGPQLARALKEGEVTLIVGVPRLYDALLSGIRDRARSRSPLYARLFDAGLKTCATLREKAGLDAGRVLMRPLRDRIGPKLKTLASGGAPLDPGLAGELEAVGWRVAVGYGLTETSPLLSLKEPDGEALDSVGRPVGRVVPIDPGRAGSSSLAFGSAVLGRGKSLVWFPEGQRSPDGKLGSFKRGIGTILDHHRVPVVPVHIGGTEKAMPVGKLFPRPTEITVVFGEPVETDELERLGEGGDPRDRIVSALRDRVAELADRG